MTRNTVAAPLKEQTTHFGARAVLDWGEYQQGFTNRHRKWTLERGNSYKGCLFCKHTNKQEYF